MTETATTLSNATESEQHALQETLPALRKAAADQLRLTVLRILRRDTFSVQELCQILADFPVDSQDLQNTPVDGKVLDSKFRWLLLFPEETF